MTSVAADFNSIFSKGALGVPLVSLVEHSLTRLLDFLGGYALEGGDGVFEREFGKLLVSVEEKSFGLKKTEDYYRSLANKLDKVVENTSQGDVKIDPESKYQGMLDERLQFITVVFAQLRYAKSSLLPLEGKPQLKSEALRVLDLTAKRLYALYSSIETVRDLIASRDAMTEKVLESSGIDWLDSLCAKAV